MVDIYNASTISLKNMEIKNRITVGAYRNGLQASII